jgi:hypothetical protein
MREIGAALRPDSPPDPESTREIYAGTPAASCADPATALFGAHQDNARGAADSDVRLKRADV